MSGQDQKEKHGKILTYDLCALPNGMKLQDVMDIFREHNIILYDGQKCARPTSIVIRDESAPSKLDTVKIIDINSKEAKPYLKK